MLNEIHTGFYSSDTAYVLKKFYSCMESGKFGHSAIKNAACVSVDHDPDGEVVIRFIHDTFNTVYEKKRSNAEIITWLGGMLKRHTSIMLKRCGWDKHDRWNRGNFNTLVDFLSDKTHKIYVGDIYYIYDALLCRKNIDKYYDSKIIEKWSGKQNDPIMTEAEHTRREEIKKIETEYDEKIENCNYKDYKIQWGYQTKAQVEMYAKYKVIMDEAEWKILQMENEFGEKWKKEAERLKAEKAEKIKAINDSMNMLRV